jgi:3-dehydroquinate dehydratase II
MKPRLMILNGSNLNLLGEREPHIYGFTSLSMIEESCRAFALKMGCGLDFHQSNHEGVLIDHIQAARKTADALIVAPAGYSYTSVSIVDALRAYGGPVIELHVSNIHARGAIHQHSIVSGVARSVISGLGPYGYIVAIQAALYMLEALPAELAPPTRNG